MLKDANAEGIEHPGGTLLAHLKRVEALLASWEGRSALWAAGLCHAFYGTDGPGAISWARTMTRCCRRSPPSCSCSTTAHTWKTWTPRSSTGSAATGCWRAPSSTPCMLCSGRSPRSASAIYHARRLRRQGPERQPHFLDHLGRRQPRPAHLGHHESCRVRRSVRRRARRRPRRAGPGRDALTRRTSSPPTCARAPSARPSRRRRPRWRATPLWDAACAA